MSRQVVEDFKKVTAQKLLAWLRDPQTIRELDLHLQKAKDARPWIDACLKALLEEARPPEDRYRAMQLLKELSMRQQTEVGPHLRDKCLERLYQLVVRLRDERKSRANGHLGETDRLWRRRLEQLLLNCFNAWTDVFDGLPEFHTYFSQLIILNVRFPGFEEFRLSLFVDPTLPYSPPEKPPQDEAQDEQLGEDPEHGKLAGQLQQYRLVLSEMIENNQAFEECRLGSLQTRSTR